MKRTYLFYLAVPVLIVTLFAVPLASEGPTQWAMTGELAKKAAPEYQRHLDVDSIPWLDSKENAGIAYLLFQSPARIERYDMNAEAWLADISLSDTPTALCVVWGMAVNCRGGERTMP
jgi:hypothetical protein